jgi:hypothetical protein
MTDTTMTGLDIATRLTSLGRIALRGISDELTADDNRRMEEKLAEVKALLVELVAADEAAADAYSRMVADV